MFDHQEVTLLILLFSSITLTSERDLSALLKVSAKNERTEAHGAQKEDPCSLLYPLHRAAQNEVPQDMLAPLQGNVRSQ
jgi:hypothetical protein